MTVRHSTLQEFHIAEDLHAIRHVLIQQRAKPALQQHTKPGLCHSLAMVMTAKFQEQLINLPLEPHIYVSELGQHWLRYWLVAWSALSHCLNQCWVGSLGTNLSEIRIQLVTFSFKKMRQKMSSAKWRPFCPGEDELTLVYNPRAIQFNLDCHQDYLSSLYIKVQREFIVLIQSLNTVQFWKKSVASLWYLILVAY